MLRLHRKQGSMQRNKTQYASTGLAAGLRRSWTTGAKSIERTAARGLLVVAAAAAIATTPDAMGQPVLEQSPSDLSVLMSPQDVNAEIQRLQATLDQTQSQQERDRIEQRLRTLRGSGDYFVKDPTLSAYRTYQAPTPEDGLVHYEIGRQLGATTISTCGAGGCNCGGPCRKGIGCPHPWRTGPGWCDDWCVGPHWDVSVDGLFMRRENMDVGFLETAFAAPAGPVEQFFFEPGARGYVTGRGLYGYDLQLGYVGVDAWRAYADFPLAGGVDRNVEYRSGFHSGELNIYPQIGGLWRIFTGPRYFELGEDFWVRDTPTDAETSAHVENKLIGFQVGVRRELWYLTDWAYVEALFNGGIYQNSVKRFNRSGTISGGTSIVLQREYSEIAFVGEVALTVVARLNDCIALRGGYQALFLDGITTAQDVYFYTATRTDSLVYHGAHVGLEYRR